MFNYLKKTLMFETIITKSEEFFRNFWVKILSLIPLCFFNFAEREKVVVFALLMIMLVDCFLGIMKSSYVDKNFSWNLLAKKFSMKFIMYFLFLGASFILSKAFELVGWWFWAATSLIAFSEFGSLALKAQSLGLPIKSDIITALNCKLENWVLSIINGATLTTEQVTQKFEETKAEKLAEYNTEKAVTIKKSQNCEAIKEEKFVKETAKRQKEFVHSKSNTTQEK